MAMTLVDHLEELRRITPGADPYSPLILGVAFTVLFFVSMGLIRLSRSGLGGGPNPDRSWRCSNGY